MQIVLWFVPTILLRVSAFGASLAEDTFSLHDCCTDVKFLSYLTVAFLAIAIVLNALSGLFESWKAARIIGIVVTVWYLALVLIQRIGANMQLENQGYSSVSKVSLTASGVIMLVVSVLVIVVHVSGFLFNRKSN